MSKFSDEQKSKEEARARADRRNEKLAAYLYDISKLSLGGVVFTSAFAWFSDKSNFEYAYMALVGFVMAVSFAVAANKLLK